MYTYKHVILVGIDGAGNFYRHTAAPTIRRVMAAGAGTDLCLTAVPTDSAQCWGSMLMGVTCKIHGLHNDKLSAAPSTLATEEHPTIYRMIRRAGFGRMPGLEMPASDREALQEDFAPDDTFSSALAKSMVARELTVKELRWKANLSSTRLNAFLKSQMPSKSQAMAVVLGMGLDLTYARQLLATARLFLDATEDQDLLVEYCMTSGQHDAILANQLLFAMDLPQRFCGKS